MSNQKSCPVYHLLNIHYYNCSVGKFLQPCLCVPSFLTPRFCLVDDSWYQTIFSPTSHLHSSFFISINEIPSTATFPRAFFFFFFFLALVVNELDCEEINKIFTWFWLTFCKSYILKLKVTAVSLIRNTVRVDSGTSMRHFLLNIFEKGKDFSLIILMMFSWPRNMWKRQLLQ